MESEAFRCKTSELLLLFLVGKTVATSGQMQLTVNSVGEAVPSKGDSTQRQNWISFSKVRARNKLLSASSCLPPTPPFKNPTLGVDSLIVKFIVG